MGGIKRHNILKYTSIILVNIQIYDIIILDNDLGGGSNKSTKDKRW